MPVLSNSVLPGATGSGSVLNQIGSAVGSSVLGSVGLSSASLRKNVADMYAYSQNTTGPAPIYFGPPASQDWRVRLSLAPNSNYFYNAPNNSLLSPLVTDNGGTSGVANALGGLANNAGLNINGVRFGGATGSGATRIGVVWPYTPQIQVQHTATYQAQKLTHNNYTQWFYDSSSVDPITISGEFTVQNVNEGQYLLATVYFFRACTKMFYGADPQAGNPPPLLYLNGYGQYYLPNVPCVITNFSHNMPADVDYMDIPEPAATNVGNSYNPQFTAYRNNSTRLPTSSTVSVTVQPVYSRLAQSQGFSLEDFARGSLINPVGAGLPATSMGASQTAQYASNFKNGGFL